MLAIIMDSKYLNNLSINLNMIKYKNCKNICGTPKTNSDVTSFHTDKVI